MESLSILNPEMVMDHETLKELILISLFTDQRAEEDELSGEDNKGYWADESMGSKLWLLDREKASQPILDRAKEYAESALSWLIDDGFIGEFEINTSYEGEILFIHIEPLGITIDATNQTIP